MGRDEETNNIQWGPNPLEQEAEKYTTGQEVNLSIGTISKSSHRANKNPVCPSSLEG